MSNFKFVRVILNKYQSNWKRIVTYFNEIFASRLLQDVLLWKKGKKLKKNLFAIETESLRF